MKYFHNDMFLLAIIFLIMLSCFGLSEINNKPIIGIVTEECLYNSSGCVKQNSSSFIVASYVKFAEIGGARVVPIMIRKDVEYYQDLMSKINGVIFPGGGTPLKGDGYGLTGKIIFKIAVKMNNEGHYFPLWGTCLGFELLNCLVADQDWMKACAAMDMPTNIHLSEGFENSRMFENLDDSLKNIMLKANTAIHYHRWCFTPQNYSTSHLNEYFKVLATNKDLNGMDFISIIEAYKYPFYGVAFHPEKVLFEWVSSKTHKNIPHTAEAVKVSQYFSRFFVNEARKSSHHFPSKKEEDAALIYNYNPVYTGKKNSSYEQKYYFNE